MKTINNNIKEQHVGFTNGKLLKEAGFDVYCQSWCTEDGSYYYNQDKEQTLGWNNKHLPKSEFSRPTQQLAIDWIRINFGIHINIWYASELSIGYHLINIPDGKVIDRNEKLYNTPEEAKEAAIEYCLTNLIK